MKRSFLFLVMFLSSCTLLFGSPTIKFNKLEHDFGTLSQKTIVKETFVFKNNGDSTLKIDKIDTSCGCTGTLLSKDTIPAGGEGTIEVTFNSGSFNGKIVRTITVHTNDPANKEIKIKILAMVKPK
jgi:hypothetical protein